MDPAGDPGVVRRQKRPHGEPRAAPFRACRERGCGARHPPAPVPSATAAPTQIAAQHILVAFRGAERAPSGVTRSKAQARVRAAEVDAKAKAGADFTGLVAEYSDDPAAKERMGSLGKFTRDKMDKAFSDAAFALRVDEVSVVRNALRLSRHQTQPVIGALSAHTHEIPSFTDPSVRPSSTTYAFSQNSSIALSHIPAGPIAESHPNRVIGLATSSHFASFGPAFTTQTPPPSNSRA